MGARYRGFWGRFRSNLLIEKALQFGRENYGLDLRPWIAPAARPVLRQHLEEDGIPNTKEEVFFALAVAVVGIVPQEVRQQLRSDLLDCYLLKLVSEGVMAHFFAEASKYTGEDPEEDGRQWVTEAIAQAE